MRSELFEEVLKHSQNNDATTEILNLWTQFTVLLSETCNTAAITKLNEEYPLQEAKKYIAPWSSLIKNIEAFRNKLSYCVQNNLPNLIYGKSERLFGLSDGREQAILGLKNLVEDLKHTEQSTTRYNNLRTSIISLFNSVNILLTEARRILEGSNYEARTDIYDLSDITKRDIGLD